MKPEKNIREETEEKKIEREEEENKKTDYYS